MVVGLGCRQETETGGWAGLGGGVGRWVEGLGWVDGPGSTREGSVSWRQPKPRCGAEQGAYNTAADPRPGAELVAGSIPDRGVDP